MSYRVKYYSPGDLGRPSIMNKVDEVYKSFDSNKTDYNINEILEFYNIDKYLADGTRLRYWNEDNIKKWSMKLKSIYNKYINSVCDENFETRYNQLEYNYIEDFWYLLSQNRVYERISIEAFDNFTKNKNPKLYLLLENDKIVTYYDCVIKEYFLGDIKNAKFLLDKYEMERGYRKKDIYIPPSLSMQQKEKIISDYIDIPDVNINYLRVIENIKSSKDGLVVSDKIKLKAKKRIEQVSLEYFKNNKGMSFKYEVGFIDSLEKEYSFHTTGCETRIHYNSKWIADNSDYPTLLNNFIYLLYYVDDNFRITCVSKQADIEALESICSTKAKNSYSNGWVYEHRDKLSNLQMQSYYHQLDHINIRMEDLFEWFFNVYCIEEFKIKDYHIKLPSANSTYFEKCRAILPEMERVLKIFNQLLEDNEVNLELLEMSSSQFPFEFYGSFLNKKYFYANPSDELSNLNFFFFSDQCSLHYVERLTAQYNSFYDLITNENISIDDYKGHSEREIKWLIDKNYIFINENSILKIKNLWHIYILKDLYENEVINYWRYSQKLQEIVDDLFIKEFLVNENTLFSKPEQDYFSYHLDNKRFNNALGLRNLYLHGSQPRGDNERIHYNNYMIFLKLLSMYMIKINDELCLGEELRGIDEGNI